MTQKDDAVKKYARSILEDQAYKDSVKQRLIAGKAPHLETMLFHYAYGKPAEKMTLEAGTTLADLVVQSRKQTAEVIDAEIV
jgi:hypothetical protein